MRISIFTNEYRMVVLGLVLMFLLPVSCSGMIGYRGRQATETPIELPFPGKSLEGTWQTQDLRVDYRIDREKSRMAISGTVDLAPYLQRGFQTADWLVVRAQLLDEARQISDSAVLLNTGDRTAIEPWPFKLDIEIPDGAKAVSFSYWGQLSSGGSMGEDRIEWQLWKGP